MNDLRLIVLTAIRVILVLPGALLYGGGLVLAVSFGIFPYWILAFLPGVGQVYLIWLIWQTTTTLINLYTIVTCIFGCLLALFVIIAAQERNV